MKDEPLLELGRTLQLPPWLAPHRDVIQQALPEPKLPNPETCAELGPTPTSSAYLPAAYASRFGRPLLKTLSEGRCTCASVTVT